jgi:nucleoside-diphosphate-sugar epimerase
MSKQVLVTGANGFVGRAVVAALARAGYGVRAAVRREDTALALDGLDPAARSRVTRVVTGEVGPDTGWGNALHGVDAVVHLVARVHVMRETAMQPLEEFRRVNVQATLNLARQAQAASVRRFVFMSSIKVNGEQTEPRRPYRATDLPAPVDPYGVSKREAEELLRALAADKGPEVCIIRPVLVYGPGVKGNFLAMMKLLRRGLPLPLGRIDNRRSLVALDNLADLVRVCIDHPSAANQTFLVSDDADLSTPELLRSLGAALGRPARLLPVPPALLRLLANLSGREALARRICGSLQVDISATRALLGWTPPVKVDDALRATARDFLRADHD